MSSTLVPRWGRLAVAPAVVVLVLLFGACDGGDSAPSAGEPSRATPTQTSTPGAPPPPMESPSATTSPGPTPSTEDGAPYGLALVDVESGVATTLYEATSAFFLVDTEDARSTRNGSIVNEDGTVWVSPDQNRSIRFEPDGTVVEEIEGWSVLESPDGSSRSYFVGGGAATSLIVERDGERYELTASESTWRRYSPDGTRLAWTSPADRERGTLHVLDIATGDVTDVATGPVPPFNWSPSGRYLAYGRPSGITILDTTTGETASAVGRRVAYRQAWIELDGTEWLLTVVANGARLTPVGEGIDEDDEPRDLPLDGADSARALSDEYVLVTAGTGLDRITTVFNTSDATIALELHGESDVVATPAGLVSAVVARTELACTGIEIVHPGATQLLPCDADFARWSPDGRQLALIPSSATAPVEVFDIATGETRELPHVGPRGTVPAWSADGRYLVWVWMPVP